MNEKIYEIRLNPLTAIHIGTGNDIDMLQYTIAGKKGGPYFFYRLQLEKLVSELKETVRNKFYELISENDYIGIRELLVKNLSASSSAILYKSEISDDIRKEFKEKKNQMNNQLLIQEMIRDPLKFRPYIPGSSLKGSLRTGILNSLCTDIEAENMRNLNALDIEKRLLSYTKLQDDPFKNLKISDCFSSEIEKCDICNIINYNPKKENRFASINIRSEIIPGLLLGADNQFIGSIKLNSNKQYLKVSEIIKNCDDFYFEVFNEEYNRFFQGDPCFLDSLKKISELITQKDEKSCLIRLGRYSQFEAVTMKPFRDRKDKKHISHKHGSTRMLVNYKGKYLPMGWALLSFVEKYPKKQNTVNKKIKIRLKTHG